MDCSVVATRHGLFLVSTTDFFYPNVEDPYLQGQIAAANVLSDLYAMGIKDVDTVLMLLAVSMDMAPGDADITTAAIIRGFCAAVAAAGASVTGGQTVRNPWPIIGGVASSTLAEAEFIRPGGLVPGDVLVLTKPLGTQLAVNLWQWRDGKSPRWDIAAEATAGSAWPVTRASAAAAFDAACASMRRLNKAAAGLMHTYGAHGATDITGFGVIGHAGNLAAASTHPGGVKIVLHTLPVLTGMLAVDKAVGGGFGLVRGTSSETSGGLLVAFPTHDAAAAFIEAVSLADNAPAWIVGRVDQFVEGVDKHDCNAVILEDATWLEV